jgi:hypothetical protein
MKRGPKGAEIETQLEVTATRTWKFTREELVKRLGLPADAKLYMHIPGTDSMYVDVSPGDPLIAAATETRRPKAKGTEETP